MNNYSRAGAINIRLLLLGFVDYKESEQLSIFDEWNRAVLIRKEEESDECNPAASFIGKITKADSGNLPMTKAQGERLKQLYRVL